MRKHKTNFLTILSGFLTLQLALLGGIPSIAQAGGTIKIDDTRSISVGMGLRSSFNLVEDAAPNGSSYSKDFTLESFRLYLGGQLHEIVTFEFNADYDTTPPGTEDVRVLDAVLKFKFSELVQVWAGRFLPPSDRSNLSGPYYLNAWTFPFVQKYPAVFAGRDDGLAIFGQIDGGRFKYQVGVFEGTGENSTTTVTETTTTFTDSGGDTVSVPVTTTTTVGGPNQSGSLLYAGRLTLNLLDPEPGYYNSSTYYGSKDVLAIGLVAMSQKNSVGTLGSEGDFNGWNIDILAEKNLAGTGVATLEGAFYDYDNDGKAGGEGDGYFVLGSFLLPNKVGPGALKGQLQPMVRYQEFSNEGLTTGDHTRLDLGVSHIISGHNARISLTYSMDESAAKVDTDMILLGFQFQI